MKFDTVEIKGKKFDVSVENDGRFYASDGNGDGIYAPTFGELKSKLAARMARSKVKVNIPFVRYRRGEPSGLRKGTITGIHASNNNLLVQWEGAKGTEQESGYRSEQYIPPQMADQLLALGLAKDKAAKAYEEFVEAHDFNGLEAVRKALGDGAGVLEDK